MEKRELSYTAGGNVSWHSHYGKECGGSSENQQSNAQNFPSQASTVCELRMSRCSSWIQTRQRNQRSNCQHPLDHRKSKRVSEKIYFCFINYTKAFDCVDHNILWKNSSRDGNTRSSYLSPEKRVYKKQELEPCIE